MICILPLTTERTRVKGELFLPALMCGDNPIN